MSDVEAIGIFLVIGVAAAVACHWKLKKYVAASLLAGLTGTVVYQIVDYAIAGYMDPYFLMSMVNGFVAYVILAFVVGMAFVYMRKNNSAPDNK